MGPDGVLADLHDPHDIGRSGPIRSRCGSESSVRATTMAELPTRFITDDFARSTRPLARRADERWEDGA
jgi:hypothetical protein